MSSASDLQARLVAAGVDDAKAREIVAVQHGGGGCCDDTAPSAPPPGLEDRRAAALDDDGPLPAPLEELAVGLALDARRDYAASAGVPYLDGADAVALSTDALKKGNWVTRAGGLPKFIKRVAKHLQEKGMDESHAIATAVNVVKKYCAKGDLNFPGKQTVTAKTKAEGCKAVAEWEAKKASTHAD